MNWSDPSRAPTSAFSVGQRVRAVRGEVSQSIFAARLGVDRKTVGRWESGDLMLSTASAIRMRQEFGTDINWLLTGAITGSSSNSGVVGAAWAFALRSASAGSLELAARALGLLRYRVIVSPPGEAATCIFESDDLSLATEEAGLAPYRSVLDLYDRRCIDFEPSPS